jgi:pimeloyl-ACP methyl ester carboxylesterase
VTTFVRTADNRRLAVEVTGDPRGFPVFFLHGTPGSKVGALPRGLRLGAMGVRLIAFDRPGYGESARLIGRTVADVALDVEAIADQLGLDRFAVIGRSGGGPHALACAAVLQDRVTRAAALVSLAPWDAAGLDWFAGMADSNIDAYTSASTDPEQYVARLVVQAAELRANPRGQLPVLSLEMPESDRQVVADAGIRTLLTQNVVQALRYSHDGWLDDVLAFCAPWGFDPADIRLPVLLWHGAEDVFSPVAHTRWLADQIPGARSWTPPTSGHFAALSVFPDIVAWLIRPLGAESRMAD